MEGRGETLTRWYFELGIKANMFINFNYASGSRVVKAVKMEDKYGWKQLNQNLSVRFTRTSLVGLRLRDTYECVLYCAHRIVLFEFRCQSQEHVCGQNGRR